MFSHYFRIIRIVSLNIKSENCFKLLLTKIILTIIIVMQTQINLFNIFLFVIIIYEEIYQPGRLYRSNQRFDSMDLSLVEGLNFEDRTFHLILVLHLNAARLLL